MANKKQRKVKRKKSVLDKGITSSMMCDLRMTALDEISRLLSNPHLRKMAVEFNRDIGFSFKALVNKDNVPNSTEDPFFKHGQFGYFEGEALGNTMEMPESAVRLPDTLNDIYENMKVFEEKA